jgi:hypothetical protein
LTRTEHQCSYRRMGAPDLSENSDGSFFGVCGKCLATSGTIRMADAFLAWTELLALGWRSYVPTTMAWGARPYAICPKCAVSDLSIEAAVKRAQKSRKRK